LISLPYQSHLKAGIPIVKVVRPSISAMALPICSTMLVASDEGCAKCYPSMIVIHLHPIQTVMAVVQGFIETKSPGVGLRIPVVFERGEA
jgi:hypothetical protein